MRIVIVSDTHGLQDQMPTLFGDVLIHCGDLCGDDDGADLPDVDAWLGRQDFAHRLCVAGNHDFLIERREQFDEPALSHALLLHDRGVVIDGLRFYGAPWLPDLPGWAYHLDDAPRKEKWGQISSDTDVLITHTPPFEILDRGGDPPTPKGCRFLRERVFEIRPAVHCFGHVHASFGEETIEGVRFINAAQVRHGALAHQPVVIEL